MLLGDADVHHPFREGGGEPVETGRVDHRRADGDDPLVHRPQLEDLLGEHVGPLDRAGTADGHAGLGVDLADRVEAVLLVVLRRGVAVALAGQTVHQDGSTELLGVPQRAFDGRLVVTVDRADVLQPEIGEHALRRDHVLEPALDAVQQVVGGAPEQRRPVDLLADELEHLLVPGVGAQPGQVPGQPTDRRRVGATVVVDQDHQRQVVVGRDVVERLPGHAAGQRTVAHQRHHGAGLALQLQPAGDAGRVRQRGRRVGALHPVVLGLRAARVAGQATLLPQGREGVLATGQHLVHVALVTGVEDDGVVRGLEDAMQGDGQLDHAEVGSEVPAGLTDLVDQEGTDLGGQRGQLVGTQPTEVGRVGDGAKQFVRLVLGDAGLRRGGHEREFTCRGPPGREPR